MLYTWGVYHQSKDQYTQQAQGGTNSPMPYLFYDYDVDDVRRDITCVPYKWSKELVAGKSYQELSSIDKWCFGKLRYEWMKRIVTSTNDDGINWQYMRLADVYLMAAEAVNYLDGPDVAWQYMEPVLNRALPAAKVAALKAQYTVSKDAFQKGIVDQRALEFAGEALRKADLVRWGIIDEKMAECTEKLKRLANRQDEYADLPSKVYVKTYSEGDAALINRYNMYMGDSPNPNGESIIIYGLNHGDDTEAINSELKDAGFASKDWFESKDGLKLKDDYINGIYVNTPSLNCLWPIWQTFVNSSNGLINNDGNYGQLSD